MLIYGQDTILWTLTRQALASVLPFTVPFAFFVILRKHFGRCYPGSTATICLFSLKVWTAHEYTPLAHLILAHIGSIILLYLVNENLLSYSICMVDKTSLHVNASIKPIH